MHCKYPIYIITNEEDAVTRFTEAKLFYDENNRGQFRSIIHLADSLKYALIHARQNYADWVFFIRPGHVFLSGFWEAFHQFQLVNDPGIVAHIMPGPEPILHDQAIAVNLRAIGDEIVSVANVSCSPLQNSRGYPTSVFLETEFFVTSLCRHVLEGGYNVVNWTDNLRDHKLYFYPKTHNNLVSALETLKPDDIFQDHHSQVVQSVQGTLDRNKKILWVVNNNVPYIPTTEHLICPASGLFWLTCDSTQVTVFDYNTLQLQFAKQLWDSKPENTAEWIYNWLTTHDCYPNLMHDGNFTLADVEKHLLGVKLNYNKTVEFIELDVVNDYEQLCQYTGATVWLSNILDYEPNIATYGISNLTHVRKSLQDRGLAVILDGPEIAHGWI
jgi:hypothetical protein